jgi:hypothetical protein
MRSTTGDTAPTPGTSTGICSASPVVIGPADRPGAADRCQRATRLSSPSASTCASASRRAPSLTDIIAITAATPSTTPRTLNDVRSL